MSEIWIQNLISTSPRKGKSLAAKTPPTSSDFSEWLSQSLKCERFAGMALSGGKANKAAIAILDYYPEQSKLFLRNMFSKISNEEDETADTEIVNRLNNEYEDLKLIAVDAALQFPKCMRCHLKCPGIESCGEKEIKWMWKQYKKLNHQKKPKKIFTPYTERCVELYVNNQLEEKFDLTAALGSNSAALSIRAMFLKRRINAKMVEAFPRLSLWRIGRNLRIQKSYLRNFRHAVDGKEIRTHILDQILESELVFIYEADRKIMAEDLQAFEAFVCALTAVLKHKDQVVARPKDFPKSEAWIEIPKTSIDW